MSLLAELKRRNVFRVAMFYAVAGWVLLQVGDLLFGALGVPPWGIRLLLGILVLGFPMALVFAWVYELTPEGLKREHEVDRTASIGARTGTKLNVLIAGLLVLAIGLVVADRFLGRRAPAQPTVSSTAAEVAPGKAAAAGGTVPASIAVLPFVNMSDDRANEYFSDGLTEELLNLLANVQGLRVIARTSSFSYKGKEVKISDVARELDVDHVLEGSVRKAGNRVRITTQLIRSSDSSHLWSQTYDRDLTDIFAVQDEIAAQVVDALKVQLLPTDAGRGDVGGTQNPKAYEAFLRGQHLLHKGVGEATLRESLAAYDEAIRLDPQYARAYAGKAEALLNVASNAYVPFATGFEQARQVAMEALRLAPDLAESYLPLANIQIYVDADPAAAIASVERALQLNPGSYDVQVAHSSLQASIGNMEQAVAAARSAVRLDPISPGAHQNLANILVFARQYEQAENAARQALALDSGRPAAHYWLGWSLLLQGRSAEALAEFDAESIDWQRRVGRAVTLARMGKTDLARQELASFEKMSRDAASYQYAQICAALGEKDEAFRWLANARRVRDPGLMAQVFADPILDPLRPDPRWEALVRELKFVRGGQDGS
jgi:TolB-like protein/Tfp pilus assembly protein PilF